jgi:hypothetical protein
MQLRRKWKSVPANGGMHAGNHSGSAHAVAIVHMSEGLLQICEQPESAFRHRRAAFDARPGLANGLTGRSQSPPVYRRNSSGWNETTTCAVIRGR